MTPFVKWIDDKGFNLLNSYDPVHNTWSPGGRMELLGIQRDVLGYALTQNERGEFPCTTFVYSTIKKSGKTAIGSAIGSYFFEEGPPGAEIYVIANDMEQAQGRVFRGIDYHGKKRGWPCLHTKYRIDKDDNSFVQALAQEYKSAAGAHQALTIWDELWAYTSARSRLMWAEMTPVPTVPLSLRVVVTYAGIRGQSKLLEDLYHTVVRDKSGHWGTAVPELEHIRDGAGNPVCFQKGSIFAYWDTMPRMPWQLGDVGKAYYDDQFRTLPPSDYMRLHENQWVTMSERFIPDEWWDRAQLLDGSFLQKPPSSAKLYPVTLAVDAGVRRDSSAIVGIAPVIVSKTPEGGGDPVSRLEYWLACHRIWEPIAGETLDIEDTIAREIIMLTQKLRVSRIVCDPTHLYQLMTSLKKRGIRVEAIAQNSIAMIQASQLFYDVLRDESLKVYPAQDLREHIQNARAEATPRGFRLVKEKGVVGHMDGAVAMAMALLSATEHGAADPNRQEKLESPFADTSRWNLPGRSRFEPAWLPDPLKESRRR
jgi:hypothetical protein